VPTPGRYVGAEAAEEDHEPFADKMARLVAVLRAQEDAAPRLDAAIAATCGSLGMGDEPFEQTTFAELISEAHLKSEMAIARSTRNLGAMG
jgi:hypothetical protein